MNALLLNDRLIQTDRPPGVTLLDFVRYENHLKGTKIGCREGDCGACTVLVGTLRGDNLRYESITSCISPLGNAFGKHVVTIDGLRMPGLSVVQSALVEEGGTQCGFCTPGFAVSMTGFCLNCEAPDLTHAIASVDGNICRCTGYKSIERSIAKVIAELKQTRNLEDLVEKGFVPSYFLEIPKRLAAMNSEVDETDNPETIVAGGTDLYVQRPEELSSQSVGLISTRKDLKGIRVEAGSCRLGGATTVTELLESEELNQIFPNLRQHLKLVSSTQIRNMATLAGNFVNASPIGDMTIFFLALDATLHFSGGRKIPLKDFYLGYKKLSKNPEEIIESVEFEVPGSHHYFNFEKVGKRTHLDIASVNSALQIELDEDCIQSVHLSAGGIGPVPAYLEKTAESLQGKKLSTETVKSASNKLATEISPISDARGSAEYKRMLLRQLFFAHFIELFPERFTLEGLV